MPRPTSPQHLASNQFAPCTCHLILLGRDSQCKRKQYDQQFSRGDDGPVCPEVKCPQHPQLHESKQYNGVPAGFLQQQQNVPPGPPPIHSTSNHVAPPVETKYELNLSAVTEDAKRPRSRGASRGGSKVRNGSKSRNSKSPSNSRRGSKSILEGGEDKKTLQRRLSKNTAFWKASTLTLPTVESVGSPRFMWDKYLKHFTPNQLDLLYKQFDDGDVERCGKITVEEALSIVADWNEVNHELDLVEPEEGPLQEILKELGKGAPPSNLNFEQFVNFVRLCETNVLQSDVNAGFSTEELADLSDVFEAHSKERTRKNPDGTLTDEIRRSLSTTEVFEVLQDAGRDTSELEQQLPIVDIIKEMDVDRSGDLDWEEFLQFMRKVRMLDAVTERESEHKRVCECKFNDAELEDFQQLFFKYTENSEGIFYVDWFVEIVESTSGSELDKSSKAMLKQHCREFGCLQDNATTISFGQFLVIMRRLLDDDICGVRSAEKVLLQQMEEDRKYLSPEEYQAKYEKHEEVSKTSSWVRRMLDNKAQRRASRLSLKGNNLDSLMGA